MSPFSFRASRMELGMGFLGRFKVDFVLVMSMASNPSPEHHEDVSSCDPLRAELPGSAASPRSARQMDARDPGTPGTRRSRGIPGDGPPANPIPPEAHTVLAPRGAASARPPDTG